MGYGEANLGARGREKGRKGREEKEGGRGERKKEREF